jgi:hypothetical protein
MLFYKPARLGVLSTFLVCFTTLPLMTFAGNGRAELASTGLLRTPNLNPFAVLAHTPSAESAHLVPANTFEVRLSRNIANNFVSSTTKNETRLEVTD